MKLTAIERIELLNKVLPKEGSFYNLKLIRQAKEALSFDDKENKELNFKTNNGFITWNPNIQIEKDVRIGGLVSSLIKDSLIKLSKDEKLPESCFSLYEKYVEGGRQKTKK